MAHVVKASKHATASFDHLFDGGFSHRSNPEDLALEVVLSADDLGAVVLLESGPPAVVNALRVEDGGHGVATLPGVSQ